MLRKVLKIISNIFTFIVFAILVLIIFAKVNMIVNKSDYFSFFGYSFFNVSTGSMSPTINQNDVILVKESIGYEVDDIITYRKDKDYITHRIVSIDDDDLITKGDANNTSDSSIKKEDIIGKVIKIFPGAGIWQKILTTPSIIIAIFVTLLLFDFAISYKGSLKDIFNTKSKLKKEIVQENYLNNLSNEEILKIYEKVESMKNKKDDVKLSKSEEKFLEYTIGLDLNEIKQEIKEKINKEQDEN